MNQIPKSNNFKRKNLKTLCKNILKFYVLCYTKVINELLENSEIKNIGIFLKSSKIDARCKPFEKLALKRKKVENKSSARKKRKNAVTNIKNDLCCKQMRTNIFNM